MRMFSPVFSEPQRAFIPRVIYEWSGQDQKDTVGLSARHAVVLNARVMPVNGAETEGFNSVTANESLRKWFYQL